MANVTPNIPPSAYLDPQVVKLTLSPEVEYINFTENGAQPTISEYIAYDTLNPPKPFIAVTQDGRGKVVYDGGFPKFYNTQAAASTPTSFSQLNGGFKYLHNALNWVANPDKVKAGNKKVLFLGDSGSGEGYNLKGAASSDFNKSLTQICSVAGFTPTFKVRTDYASGYLDARLSELNQYACIFLMSSLSNGTAWITDACVNDIQTFREQGGGIIVVTDHGPVLTDISQAYPNGGKNQFFSTANKLIRNFGAYFSGTYDRTSVNVGFLRRTYGDHPLYNGMADSEDVSAGGSESQVVVATFDKYTNANLPTFKLDSGKTTIRVLALLKDQDVETYQFVYSIASGDLIEIFDGEGHPITGIDTDWSAYTSLDAKLLGEGLGTLAGVITLNDNPLASLAFDEINGSTLIWYGGSGSFIPVNNGDVIKVKITSPFQYEKVLPVTRKQPVWKDKVGLADVVTAFKEAGLKGPTYIDVLEQAIGKLNENYSNLGHRYSSQMPLNLKRLKAFSQGNLEMPQTQGFIYASLAQAQAAMASLTPPGLKEIFDTWDRFQGKVYYPNGSTYPEETAAWYWDNSLKQAVNSLNTSSWTGFISKEEVERYELDVTLTSNSVDDDGVGVVLACAIEGTVIQTLSLVVHRGGISPADASHSIQYNATYGGAVILASANIGVQASNAGDGWSNRSCRVKVVRNGDIFTVVTSQWNDQVLDPATKMVVDLNDHDYLARFKGAKKYGYLATSQPGATFKNVTFVGGQLYDIVVDAASNTVYRYTDGAWKVLPGVNAQSVYGAPRRVKNPNDNKSYLLNKNGSITVI